MDTTLTAWKPGLGMTAFDDSSNYMGERIEGWFVYSKHRDSDALTRSNYDCILRALNEVAEKEGKPECVEQHNQGHWGFGWFEQIVLTADTPEAVIREAESCLDALAEYPVLDESHYSELEWNEAAESWERMSPRQKVQEAIWVRERCHWLAKESVWRFGRMSFHQLVNDGSTIAESIYESLRSE